MPEDDGVWKEENVLWNYIVIADAEAEYTQVYIYRYANQRPEKGLVKLIGDEKWYSKVAPGLASFLQPEDSKQDNKPVDLEKDHLDSILELVKNVIPEKQIQRTPFFLHSTASLRTKPKQARHNLLREVCTYFKDKTDLLVHDCNEQVYDVDSKLEATLSWLSLGYLEGQFSKTKAAIDLTNGNVQAVYAAGQKNKSHAYRIRLAGDEEQLLDVIPEVYESLGVETLRLKYREESNGTEDVCMPKNLNADGRTGTGDFKTCSERLSKFVSSISNLDLEKNGIEPPVFALDRFNVYSELFNGDRSKVEEWCNDSWLNLEGDMKKYKDYQAENICFDATLAAEIIDHGFKLDAKNVDYVTKIKDTRYSWTVGRALIYATDEVNEKFRSGVQANTGSSSWQFGARDALRRPGLDGDVADRIDSGSHRLWGGIVFLLGVILVVYLLLGRTRRSQIYEGVVRRFKGDKYIDVRHGDFELDDIEDDEYEV